MSAALRPDPWVHAFLVAHDAALLLRGALPGPAPPETLVTPALLREAYGVEAAVGMLETPAGPRRVCVPLVFDAVP